LKILVTGATGFVGFNFLLRALHDPDIEAIGVSVRHGGKLAGLLALEGIGGLPEKLQVLEGDSSDWKLEELNFAPDLCFHFAGVLFARTREEYFVGNEEGTRRLLAALPANCRVIALSSQAAAGPTPLGIDALKETHSPSPVSYYGQSKLAMERILENAQKAGREVWILRPPVVIGPHDSATLPLFQMARGPIWFKPGGREKHISWIAVADLVDALFAAAPRQPGTGVYFVSGPASITDLELIQSAGATMGRTQALTLRLPKLLLGMVGIISRLFPLIGRLAPSLMPDRVAELMEDCWVIDASRFQEVCQWKPARQLQETLQETADFYRKQNAL